MTKSDQSICLCMIVKNESAVIRRCIDSVRPLISHWVIVDTGSTDGTQKIIRDYLKDIPGTLYERPWKDFAHNRSEALSLARPHAAYSLIIDADDALEIPDDFMMPDLVEDCYMMQIRDTPVLYWRKQIVSNKLTWRYRGVLHEFVDSLEPHSSATLPIGMRRNHDGARRKAADWFQKDVAVLEKALAVETDAFLISRYTFYLAQSYRDSGMPAKAISNYLARSKLGGWQEEVYFSLYQSAKLMEGLSYDQDEILKTYQSATDLIPSRIEAMHGASRYCRLHGLNDAGYQFAKIGLGKPLPSDSLFAEPWIYDFGLADEFCVNAYWVGRHDEAISVGLDLLQNAKVPEHDRARITQNIKESWTAIANNHKSPNLGALGRVDFVEQHSHRNVSTNPVVLADPPKVMIAVMVEANALFLDLQLECLEQLDYPKAQIVLHIHTVPRYEPMIAAWVDRVGPLYAGVKLTTPPEVRLLFVNPAQQVAAPTPAAQRDEFLKEFPLTGSDFFFAIDMSNLLKADSLRELVALNLPIVAPFLRSADPTRYYSNYHAEIDPNGFYLECDQYFWILQRYVRGIFDVPVVNGTYLVRADVVSALTYQDETNWPDYVVFSKSARDAKIAQYLDNRKIYGFITSEMGMPDQSGQTIGKLRALLFADDPVE